MSCWQRGHGAVSGKKRITVDEGAWQEAMRKASRLRDVERELPGMLEAVQRAQEEQAARDRTAMQARQDELTRKLASLSDQAARIEASTTRRINAAAATMMNEAREANRQLRADTRQLLDQQEQRFDAAVTAERAERRREADVLRQETDALREQMESDREARASVLDAARTAVGDARVLHDAIDSTLPHERFAPGQLARLTDRLAIAEGNVAAGTAETALGHAQELYLRLRELRAEVELRDAEWRAAHLTSVEAVTALAEQISYNSMIPVTDEESGASAELDVDHWSDGELSAIRAQADELAARLNAKADPPGLAELRDISERSVVELNDRLSEVVATARTRQWASQVRVNMAETVVDVLESVAGYHWDGNAFAGDDQRAAFYSKLRHADDSEIVVEVAPGEDGKSCVVRVMSYETGQPDESARVARVHAIADSLREQGLAGTPAAEADEPDPALKDFAQLRQGLPSATTPARTAPAATGPGRA